MTRIDRHGLFNRNGRVRGSLRHPPAESGKATLKKVLGFFAGRVT